MFFVELVTVQYNFIKRSVGRSCNFFYTMFDSEIIIEVKGALYAEGQQIQKKILKRGYRLCQSLKEQRG